MIMCYHYVCCFTSHTFQSQLFKHGGSQLKRLYGYMAQKTFHHTDFTEVCLEQGYIYIYDIKA